MSVYVGLDVLAESTSGYGNNSAGDRYGYFSAIQVSDTEAVMVRGVFHQ